MTRDVVAVMTVRSDGTVDLELGPAHVQTTATCLRLTAAGVTASRQLRTGRMPRKKRPVREGKVIQLFPQVDQTA